MIRRERRGLSNKFFAMEKKRKTKLQLITAERDDLRERLIAAVGNYQMTQVAVRALRDRTGEIEAELTAKNAEIARLNDLLEHERAINRAACATIFGRDGGAESE